MGSSKGAFLVRERSRAAGTKPSCDINPVLPPQTLGNPGGRTVLSARSMMVV